MNESLIGSLFFPVGNVQFLTNINKTINAKSLLRDMLRIVFIFNLIANDHAHTFNSVLSFFNSLTLCNLTLLNCVKFSFELKGKLNKHSIVYIQQQVCLLKAD